MKLPAIVSLIDIPPRHADLIGWPEEKSARKLIALELAEQAELELT